MNVQQLIEKLQQIEDKTLPVTIYSGAFEDFDKAEEVEIITVGEDHPYCKGYSYDEAFEDGQEVVVIGAQI